jgi:hypothetical protein
MTVACIDCRVAPICGSQGTVGTLACADSRKARSMTRCEFLLVQEPITYRLNRISHQVDESLIQ